MDSPRQSPRTDGRLRLHKYLAACGAGSRRACELLVAAGRVTVDGAPVTEQGVGVDPVRQRICLDGRPVASQAKIVLAYHKPRGILCTARDPQGRPTFLAALPPLSQRVFTVGRLDFNSEGLLVVTNDGDLAHALMHPRHGIVKCYQVEPAWPLSLEQERRLRRGVVSKGERLTVLDMDRMPPSGARPCYRIRLNAGRNRHIRRLFEALGIPVRRLCRTALGPLTLDGLPPGGWRRLAENEIEALRRAAAKPS